MATFKNMKQLETYVNAQIAKALADDVAKQVKQVMKSKIQTEVYDKYDSNSTHPDKYERRSSGGLGDEANMVSSVDGNNTLSVENVTRGQDTGMLIAGIIEYGHNGGYGSYDYPWTSNNSTGDFRQPRPFISETMKAIKSQNLHVQSLRSGLIKRGFKMG